MITAPCKDCPDRAEGCHGRCERYAAFRTAHARELENKDRYLEADAATVQSVRRMKRRNPAKRKK